MSMARLWCDQGKWDEARDLLAQRISRAVAAPITLTQAGISVYLV